MLGKIKAMHQVYEDFEDVRYEGCRYRAFAKWWRERVSTGETRGEYLFAEPLAFRRVELVSDAESAASMASEPEILLVSIPLNLQRQHIDKAIDKILKKKLCVSKGRSVRDVKASQARYSVSKHLLLPPVKRAFEYYVKKVEAEKEGKKLSNFQIADAKVLLEHADNNTNDKEVRDASSRRRVISTQISRDIGKAKALINSVGFGIFA